MSSEFFVPDEPLEELLAAYEQGEKGVTARPAGLTTVSATAQLTEIHGSTFLPSGGEIAWPASASPVGELTVTHR